MLEGHERDVRAAAVDPDGAWVATGSVDRTAQLWDLATGQLASVLLGHRGRVDAIAFSRDGTRVVTGAADSTARLWNIAGYLIATLQGHEGAVTDVEFSQDGALLATASQDGTIRLWMRVAGAAIAVLRAHTAAVTSVAMSRDGSYVPLDIERSHRPLVACASEIGTISLSHRSPRGAIFARAVGVWLLRRVRSRRRQDRQHLEEQDGLPMGRQRRRFRLLSRNMMI